MNTYKQIIFVSEMRNPKTSGSSTQIMTRNLLYGFSKICKDIKFIAVIEKPDDTEDIRAYYSEITPHIYFVLENSKDKTNIFKRQFVWLLDTFKSHRDRIPHEFEKDFNTETVLVSQSPGLDAALLCRELKRKNPTLFYIQYWGDPLALSLITPQQYNIKRSILKTIEKRLHKFADKIVYGTESLYSAQLQLFPEIAGKTTACDVGYMPDAIDRHRESKAMRFGYFGNYFSSIRDIRPLYDAFKKIEGAQLTICGSSDIKLEGTNNIEILNRISQDVVEQEESKIDVEVCVLNRVGIQIPGKIFYHTSTDKHILVLIDGPNANAIEDELRRSNRFIICHNEKGEIEKTIHAIIEGRYNAIEYDKYFYSPERICNQIIQRV